MGGEKCSRRLKMLMSNRRKNAQNCWFFSAELLHLFSPRMLMNGFMSGFCMRIVRNTRIKRKTERQKEVTRLASPQPAIHSLHSSYPRSKIIRSFRFYPRSKTECIVAVQGFVHSCSVGFCVEFAVCLCIVCVWFGAQTLHSATH